MASADQISCRNLGRQSWASALTPCGGTRDGTPGSSCPTGGSSTTLGSRRIAERLRQWGRGTGRNRSRDHPQSTQQRRAIPQSRRSRDSSLCTREPLGTGDADRPSAPTEGLPKSQQRSDVVIGPYETKRELPRPSGQRSERGKSRWSNSGFARRLSCAARGTGFGSLIGTPPVLPQGSPQLSRTV